MDYKEHGFKCGIEIHQQLDTHKLFCECPSIVHDENPDIEVNRRLRAVTGEMGEVDAAARHEQEKSRLMIYEGCSSSTCLVELDEEPPHPMNRDALGIVLQVANMLNARLADEIQVMRKTVVDGSNVSGFQRTALVAYDGYVETSMGRVRIPSICIEEEAAQKVAEDQDTIRFRLDRLGVPLIEIATEPDIQSPEHAKETAAKIGMILRSTGKVKRGIGSIRQDVNVSISGGARVEIKGFQDLRNIPSVIDYEIHRQQDLIDKGEDLVPHVRKAEDDGSTSYLRPMPGAARMYPETDVLPVRTENIEYAEVELIDDRIERLRNDFDLSEDLATKIVKREMADTFERYVNEYTGLKPSFIAETLISAAKDIKKQHDEDVDPTDNRYEQLFALLNEGKLAKDSLYEAFVALKQGTFKEKDFAPLSEEALEEGIKHIVQQMEGKPFGAVMGEVMKHYRGKVDGKRVKELIGKYLS